MERMITSYSAFALAGWYQNSISKLWETVMNNWNYKIIWMHMVPFTESDHWSVWDSIEYPDWLQFSRASSRGISYDY